MIDLLSSLRTALRKLRRAPGFAVVAVLTLALGIGANSAIFSVVHSVLLEPLPYPQSERLVAVSHDAPGLDLEDFGHSDATYLLYRELGKGLEEIGVYQNDTVNLTGGDRPQRLAAAEVTHSVLPLLGVPPRLGRGFEEGEERPGSDPVVILGHGLWSSAFGADPAALGRTLRVDGVERRVIGVMPEGFGFPSPETELWLPLAIDPAEVDSGNFNYDGVARLAPGATVDDVRRDLNALVPRLPEVYPGDITAQMLEQARFAAVVKPLRDDVVGNIGEVLWVILGTVGLILLIACANVANLFLVRAEGRGREVAVRTALGASSSRLAGQFLGESLLLGLLGGALGLLLALAGVRALVAFGPGNLPRLDEVGIDGIVLLFTLGISLLAGGLFGCVPLIRFGRGFNLTSALKEGGRGGSAGRERHRARNVLVVVQVALALVLLVGSGLMVRSFSRLRAVDVGFDPDRLLSLRVTLTQADYPEPDQVTAFYQQVTERLRALPGVQQAGAIGALPLAGFGSNSGHVIEDFPVPPGELPHLLFNNRVTPGYFETVGIPLLEGRTFERRDAEQATGAAILSRPLAERFWPGESAVGKRLQLGVSAEGEELEKNWHTVVGVVGGVRQLRLEDSPTEMVYYVNRDSPVPGRNWVDRSMTLVLRTTVDPLSLADAARTAVWEVDPQVPVSKVQTGERLVAEAGARTAFAMVLLSIAAVVALALGMIGLYGVIAYLVAQRTREIGVRLALGAVGRDIQGLVMRQGLTVTLIGVAVGLLAAVGLTRWMAALLFGVSPTDVLTLGSVALILVLVALAACWLPAHRASRVDPLVALRHE